jgi:hypothetical protein
MNEKRMMSLGAELATLLRREASLRVEWDGIDARMRQITAELQNVTATPTDDPESTTVIEMPARMRRTETPIADAVTSGEIPRVVPCPEGCATYVFNHLHYSDGTTWPDHVPMPSGRAS